MLGHRDPNAPMLGHRDPNMDAEIRQCIHVIRYDDEWDFSLDMMSSKKGILMWTQSSYDVIMSLDMKSSETGILMWTQKSYNIITSLDMMSVEAIN